MKKPVSQWLLGLSLVAYPIASLVLVLFLASYHPAKSPSLGLETIEDFTSTTDLPDFAAIEQSPERKKEFLNLLRPLVEEKNERLLKSRARLLKIKEDWEDDQQLSELSARNLETMRNKWHVTRETYPDTERAIEILMLRVDIIPTAMVLAQAAVESGWGTSRFAEEGNNLFGHWCYTQGCGLVPKQRLEGAKHEVRRFASIEESLSAYFRNINTNNSYRPWRQLRAQLRQDPAQFTAINMVAELGKYSERGQPYIDQLRKLIKRNHLE